MKKLLLLASLCLLLASAFAQFDLGNTWYKSDPNRPFVKLSVGKTGIYRVTATDLQNSIYDANANVGSLQLFHRGAQVPIFIVKNPANPSTLLYFDFLGEQNDGREDSIMYRDPFTGVHNPDLQPTKQVSLFSDTAAYFLTWGSGSAYPFRGFKAVNYTNPLPSFWYEVSLIPRINNAGVISRGGGSINSLTGPVHFLNSDYITGEGFILSGGDFGSGGPLTLNLPTKYPTNNPANPTTITTRIFGKSDGSHQIQALANGTDPLFSDTASTIFIKSYTRTYTGALNGATNLLPIKYLANGPVDNNGVCWASAIYDRVASQGMDTVSFFKISKWEIDSVQSIVIPKVKGIDSVYIYDFKNLYRNSGVLVQQGAFKDLKARIYNDPTFQPSELYVVTDLGLKKPTIENAVFSKLHAPADGGAEFVIITHRAYAASALAYKNYRDTATVNQIPAKVVYTDEIYNEYGYGSFTPWAIKRFCKEALDSWTIKPKYFLLWGKALNTSNNVGTVPGICYPWSDFEFVSHYNPFAYDLDIRAAIGRVNITSNQQGQDYLNKVIQHEHTPFQPWMKQGVFLGGGSTQTEISLISSTLLRGMNVFEGAPFGGISTYFQKVTNSTTNDFATYHQNISDGASWVHFFGHSASIIQDVSIKEPTEYSNYGKYPFFFAEGCYGGDFGKGESFGEKWIAQAQRGAIGYLANSGPGYAPELSSYSDTVYRYMHNKMFGQRVGDAIKNYDKQYILVSNSVGWRNHMRQMNLQGDPSIQLHVPAGKDIEINAANVYFYPENFSSLDDSFQINVIVRNLGSVVLDSFVLSVRQQYPNGTWYNHPSRKVQVLSYSDTISFYLQNPIRDSMTGPNQFEIYADSTQLVAEYDETNNFVSYAKIVPGNVPAILYPLEFAVIKDNTPQLVASAYGITRDSMVHYIFEMDTLHTFNSPMLRNSGVLTGKASQMKWQIPVTLIDSAVCYWRVRLADVTPIIWANASFRYIPTKEGWGQARIPQFDKDSKTQIKTNVIQQKWEFNKFVASYRLSQEDSAVQIAINGTGKSVNVQSNYLNGVVYMIIDGNTLQSKVNTPTGAISNSGIPGVLPNIGVANISTLQRFKNDIANAQIGDYYFISSYQGTRVAPFPGAPLPPPVWASLSQWTPDIFDILEGWGISDNFRSLANADRFMFFGRVGFPSSVEELYTPNVGNNMVMDKFLTGDFERGTVKSTLIGPSLNWKQLIWRWSSLDLQVKEQIDVSLYGIKSDGSQAKLMDVQNSGTYDIDSLDAATYRYMYLKGEFVDTTFRTAPQLAHWHILYDQAPDAVVDPFGDFVFKKDTIYEGENIEIRIGAGNLTDQNMDSLLVNFRLQKKDRSIVQLATKRFAPLPGNGRIPINYTFNTLDKNLDGETMLFVELNYGKDQPEQYVFNNVYHETFYVVKDKQNPLLDVTFDGKRIMDQDIVSPTPTIIIQAKDENQFIAMEDTSTFDLYFTDTRGIREHLAISLDPRLTFEPATLPNNKAKITFRPGQDTPLTDSDEKLYTLEVQSRDARGNLSGKGDTKYSVYFKVVNAHTITQVLNYPNPFSTSTRFVYTLTGNEKPEQFQIHVYTVSGKLVKIIDLKESGDIHIGKNITEYAWDGTDEYGDKLANGVYLYKVVSKMENSSIKLESAKENETLDKYFNKGWGKMYIMR